MLNGAAPPTSESVSAIEYLPLADASVDVILSTRVINLSPDKPQVFREAFARPQAGGRLAISDVVATAELPRMAVAPQPHSGRMAGAARIEDLEAMLATAGFVAIAIQPKDQSPGVHAATGRRAGGWRTIRWRPPSRPSSPDSAPLLTGLKNALKPSTGASPSVRMRASLGSSRSAFVRGLRQHT